ncbi:hypothetical protein DEFDS_P153 (plasmid) [Deferribacter desulfuricans SSM1]|uniref:Uncharacterized protein n=1 Tax=Deferribacter desulfuricans (strain DSM 14783 / JCM 11476 / NBRC 101012 / SSM1) TaxID=639282 RepID=D3PEY2_DEFDS|nr:hypothetical protein [Deferribacter desulfuricans]BAI81774.1 hypothetical protein DEFDS_P153 [Deferribacter desulfuricans SSM1]
MTYKKALRQIKEGHFFEDKEILKLANKNGWTVAHIQAKKGWITNDKEVLKLANIWNETVAHVMARNSGYTPKYKKLLQMNYKKSGYKYLSYKYAIDIYVGIENL